VQSLNLRCSPLVLVVSLVVSVLVLSVVVLLSVRRQS